LNREKRNNYKNSAWGLHPELNIAKNGIAGWETCKMSQNFKGI